MSKDQAINLIGAIALWILLLCATGARGDVVELKDGTTLTGTYAGGTANVIRLETATGVKEIQRGDASSMRFTGGSPPSPPPDPEAAVPAGAKGAPRIIPAGTLLLVRMENQVTSKDRPGTKFSGVLETNVTAGDVVVGPAGSKVYGRVDASKQAGRMIGKSNLQISLTDLNLSGKNIPITTSSFSEAGDSSFKKTARNTLVGTGVGAAFGEAGKGAAIGAGVSVIRQGDAVTVPSNAILEFRLLYPIQITVAPAIAQ
jgi:hypothetical protein